MHLRAFALIGLVAFFFASPAAAATEAGCGGDKAACCAKAEAAAKGGCDMPCCQTHKHPEPVRDAVEILLSMDQPAAAPQVPVRQATVVWFHQPVLVDKAILQGRFVIEHDNDRMARGEPCTHIYRFEDRKTPVAAFHCVHLDRPLAKEHIVMLRTAADGLQRLTEFQFAGEVGSHGYPGVR